MAISTPCHESRSRIMSATFLSACAQRAADAGTEAWELIKRSGLLAIRDFGPSKGFGVVALRDVAAGELLLREPPLLRLKPDGQGQFFCSYAHGKAQSETLIGTLSQHSYGRGLDEAAREAMTVVERAIETNAFAVSDASLATRRLSHAIQFDRTPPHQNVYTARAAGRRRHHLPFPRDFALQCISQPRLKPCGLKSCRLKSCRLKPCRGLAMSQPGHVAASPCLLW